MVGSVVAMVISSSSSLVTTGRYVLLRSLNAAGPLDNLLFRQ
jgi:hypothetical protein